MAERVGHVTEIQPPAEGKKMYSAKVGGKKVRFYGTGFESPDPSAILIVLRDADNRGKPVRATGREVPLQGSQFPMFVAESAEVVDSIPDPVAAQQNGSAPAPTFQDSNRDRSIIAQVAYKIAATLAASGAIDAEGKLEGVKTIADFIFYSILETAEGKATGAGNAQEPNQEWAQS